jgi:hypothetical protein
MRGGNEGAELPSHRSPPQKRTTATLCLTTRGCTGSEIMSSGFSAVASIQKGLQYDALQLVSTRPSPLQKKRGECLPTLSSTVTT